MRSKYGSKDKYCCCRGRRWPVSGSQLEKTLASELEQVFPTRLILFFRGSKVKV